MIALDRNMPKDCFACPCMQTFTIDKENIQNVQYLIRYCAAAKQEMVTIEWNTSENIPDVWMNWSKPKWCPWKEIYSNGKDEEYAQRMFAAGLGGSYE